MGGSISEHGGWRVLSQETIKKSFPKLIIREINDTIGGTGADLLFVEFAVNDDGMLTDKIQNSIESIIRLTKGANALPEA